MSQVMFSDDDDVTRHEEDLEQTHKSISACVTYFQSTRDSIGHENCSSFSHFDEDPVNRSILEDRKNRLLDVFLSPLAPPSKCCDVFEFDSDHDYYSGKATAAADCLLSRCTSSESAQQSDSSHSNRRRKLRLKKLHDAISSNCVKASDGDDEFIPPLREFDLSPQEENIPRMKLRTRKELWSSEDELSLADVQLQIFIAESEAEAQKFATSKQSPKRKLSSENDTRDFDDKDDLAVIPNPRQCTTKCEDSRIASRPGSITSSANNLNISISHSSSGARERKRARQRTSYRRPNFDERRNCKMFDTELAFSRIPDSSMHCKLRLK